MDIKYIAVAKDRYGYASFNLSNIGPFRGAGTTVRGNPGMKGQGICPGIFKPLGYINSRGRIVFPKSGSRPSSATRLRTLTSAPGSKM